MESTFNFLDEVEKDFQNSQAGAAPKPEAPDIEAEDFDEIPREENERISENRTTEQGRKNQESETVLLAQAKLFTGILDMANKSLCGWISKMSRDNYGFSDSEKNDLNTVTVEYLKTVEKPLMSPGEALFLTCVTVVGGNVIVALEDKKKKERQDRENEAMRRANEARTYQESQRAKEDLERVRKEDPVTEKKPQRNLFQVDKRGFYKYDIGGNYLAGKKKTEKAPAEIIIMIDECKKAGMTEGETNENIRMYLYGSKESM